MNYSSAPTNQYDSDSIGLVALKAFFNITQKWGLQTAEQIVLLGSPSRATFFNWKRKTVAKEPTHLPKDTLERISYIIGIHKALQILFQNPEQIYGWVKKSNSLAPFFGQSALEKMLRGQVVDLADVRRFLDAWRG